MEIKIGEMEIDNNRFKVEIDELRVARNQVNSKLKTHFSRYIFMVFHFRLNRFIMKINGSNTFFELRSNQKKRKMKHSNHVSKYYLSIRLK